MLSTTLRRHEEKQTEVWASPLTKGSQRRGQTILDLVSFLIEMRL